MKRPQMVNLELEDLSKDFTAILDYINTLESRIRKLEVQLYGSHAKEGIPVKDIPTDLAM